MKTTNKRNICGAIVRAVANDPYSKDGADFTTTQLANPPRAEALKKLNPDGLEQDASMRISSMLGQAVHSILERGARPEIDIIEKRFFAEIQGFKVGGKIDLFETDSQTLYEYKTCLTAAFSTKNKMGQKPEWIAQASMNAHLMKLNGVEVKKIVVVGILVDWRPWRTETDAPVVEAEVTPWSTEKVVDYINERVKLHAAALKELPKCTPKETWGGSMCKNYCEASSICSQYQDALKSGLLIKKAEGE